MKLSDYSHFLPGLTYAPADVKNDGLLVLRSSNIQNGQLSFSDNVYVDAEIVPIRIRTKEKDVLMCVRNGSKALVGKTALITSQYADLAWGAFMTILRPKCNNTFLFQYLNSASFKTQVFPDLDTATVKQITMGTLNGVHIYVPSLVEQEKIANFLQWIDARIEKQRALIETLKKYKRGLLSAVFSRKLTFGAYEEWRETTISECLQYEQPQKYIVETEQYDDSYSTPVLTANKAFVLGYTNESTGIYEKGNVIIYDDFTMDMKYVTFPFKVKSSTIKMLTPHQGFDLYFVYALLQSLELQPEGHQRSYISKVEPNLGLKQGF